MSRRLHSSGRPQQQKSKERTGDSFSIYRPLNMDSAEEIYDVLKSLRDDGEIPDNAEFRLPGTMRVTYVEKHKMSKQLQGFAAGFDARGAADRLTDHDTLTSSLQVSIGRVTLMDRRDETVVARTDHSQEMAEEYGHIMAGLVVANLPGALSMRFRPHISLVKIPGLQVEQKQATAQIIQTCLPDAVNLDAITSDPKNPRLRRR